MVSRGVPYNVAVTAPWHIRWLKLEDGPWKVTHGAGIKVALLDSGVGKIRALTQERVRRLSHDGEPIEPTDRSADSHGTSVAGIVASVDKRILGIAPEADYSAFLVYGVDGRPADFRVKAALRKATELAVDVVCCTFTLPQADDELRSAIAGLAAAGIPVIVSAGNSAQQRDEFPETVPGLITVAAHNPDGRLLPNSRYGDWTTIAAPGMRITTWKSSGQEDPLFSGTSAAAPLLTGVVTLALAQALAVGGEAGRDAVKLALADLLVETSERRGPVPLLAAGAFYDAAVAMAQPKTKSRSRSKSKSKSRN